MSNLHPYSIYNDGLGSKSQAKAVLMWATVESNHAPLSYQESVLTDELVALFILKTKHFSNPSNNTNNPTPYPINNILLIFYAKASFDGHYYTILFYLFRGSRRMGKVFLLIS